MPTKGHRPPVSVVLAGIHWYNLSLRPPWPTVHGSPPRHLSHTRTPHPNTSLTSAHHRLHPHTTLLSAAPPTAETHSPTPYTLHPYNLCARRQPPTTPKQRPNNANTTANWPVYPPQPQRVATAHHHTVFRHRYAPHQRMPSTSPPTGPASVFFQALWPES